jgi:hypothetical protein
MRNTVICKGGEVTMMLGIFTAFIVRRKRWPTSFTRTHRISRHKRIRV